MPVEAMQLHPDTQPHQVMDFLGDKGFDNSAGMYAVTIASGGMRVAKQWDWILKDQRGEFYVMEQYMIDYLFECIE